MLVIKIFIFKLITWLSYNFFCLRKMTLKIAKILIGTKCCLLVSNPIRVLVRISKMPVQNSNSKMFARPDLATNLLSILIPTRYNSLLCQKGNLHFSYVLKDDLLGKYLVVTPKSQN